jgi:hypothetical protein
MTRYVSRYAAGTGPTGQERACIVCGPRCAAPAVHDRLKRRTIPHRCAEPNGSAQDGTAAVVLLPRQRHDSYSVNCCNGWLVRLTLAQSESQVISSTASEAGCAMRIARASAIGKKLVVVDALRVAAARRACIRACAPTAGPYGAKRRYRWARTIIGPMPFRCPDELWH